MAVIRDSLSPVDDSFDLLDKLYLHYPLYALTDNVKELVHYLKSKYQFWSKFSGAIVSAEVGYLKPSPEIYQCLISEYYLVPAETLFIDDHMPNVEGARLTGMHAIQFKNAKQCSEELKQLGILAD